MTSTGSPSDQRGVVEEALPKDLFKVRLDDGSYVTASLGGLTRQTTVRIIPGDTVLIEVSPLDPSRGRIKQRVRQGSRQ